MKLNDLYRKIDAYAPKSLSDEYCAKYGAYDNSGILLGGDEEIGKVLFSLDFSSAAIAEAERIGANAVVTHHPAIYAKIGSVRDDSPAGRNLLRALRGGISVISMHLNMDCAAGGIDEYLARAGGGKEFTIVEPLEKTGTGYGRIYDVEPIEAKALYKRIVTELGAERASVYLPENMVRRVASFCGAGGDENAVLSAAKAGADCIVSADFKHHVVLMAIEYGMSVISLTHYASENYGFQKIYGKLKPDLGAESAYFCDERLL